MDKKNLTNFLKRQSFAIFSCLVVMLLGTILVSSAAYTIVRNSEKNQTVQSGTFNISFSQGNTITNDVFVATDEEGMQTDGYSFTVRNDGSIPSSYAILLGRSANLTGTHVANNYFRYSLDGQAPRTLTNADIYSGNSENNYQYSIEIKNLGASSSNTHTLRIWLDENTPDNVLAEGQVVNLSIQIVAMPNDPSYSLGENFAFTGKEEIFKAPYTGTYTIVAAGAEGAIGNTFGVENNTLKGGKGAKISADFKLNAGDIIHIIVGGKGTTTAGTAADGAAGAGGGGSYVFKEIPSIDNAKYQFEKTINGEKKYLDTLLVAAGGSGTSDLSLETKTAGIGGNGANYKSPDNFSAFSTSSQNPQYASSGDKLLGIGQYITYDFNTSVKYSKNESLCTGGFGGGNCNDNDISYGGGWSGSGYTAYSWSQGQHTEGHNGVQEGNGYVNIKFKS